MALINCPECKKKISETASKCPNCGYKIKANKIKHNITKNNIYVITVFIIIFVMFLLLIVSKNNNNSITTNNNIIKTTTNYSDNSQKNETYTGVVYELDSLTNSKKTADLFIEAMNEYITRDEYYMDSKLVYYKTTNENKYTFYEYSGKDGAYINLIFNNLTGKFHCISIHAEEDSYKYYLQFKQIRKAAMYVSGVFDKCKDENYICYLAMTGSLSYKTKYDIYEVELYVPDYTEPSFYFMSTLN